MVIHLGIVAGLFITLPYGKFAHVAYRYAALVRYSIEQRRAEEHSSSIDNDRSITDRNKPATDQQTHERD